MPTEKHSALAWLLNPAKTSTPYTRVLAHLLLAEAKEPHPHLRDDIRQAWICVSNEERGVADPFVQASYTMYGLHPDKVFPAITAMRKAMLGAEYGRFFDDQGNLRPQLQAVKKPARSTGDVAKKVAAA